MKRPPKTENDVKALVKDWFASHGAWSYSPVQNGMGVHGIHDRIGCVPIIVTPRMVGKKIGLFVSIEAKKPGRRGEERRGMSKHQELNMNEISAAGGFSIVCDGEGDLALAGMNLGDLLHG